MERLTIPHFRAFIILHSSLTFYSINNLVFEIGKPGKFYRWSLFKENISTIRCIEIFVSCMEKLLFLLENPWSLDQIFQSGSASDNTDSIQNLCGRILTNIVVAVSAIIYKSAFHILYWLINMNFLLCFSNLFGIFKIFRLRCHFGSSAATQYFNFSNSLFLCSYCFLSCCQQFQHNSRIFGPRKLKFWIKIQFPKINIVPPVNKPYVNEVTLTGQNSPLKCC